MEIIKKEIISTIIEKQPTDWELYKDTYNLYDIVVNEIDNNIEGIENKIDALVEQIEKLESYYPATDWYKNVIKKFNKKLDELLSTQQNYINENLEHVASFKQTNKGYTLNVKYGYKGYMSYALLNDKDFENLSNEFVKSKTNIKEFVKYRNNPTFELNDKKKMEDARKFVEKYREQLKKVFNL